MNQQSNDEWKDTLATFVGLALLILSVGGCFAMGGGCQVKFRDPEPVKQEAQP